MPESKTIERRNSAQFAAVCEALLERGASVRFRAQGQSMQPNILNEDAVVVAPAHQEDLRRGDVALTRVASQEHVERRQKGGEQRNVLAGGERAKTIHQRAREARPDETSAIALDRRPGPIGRPSAPTVP